MNASPTGAERSAAWVLAGIAAIEGLWIVANAAHAPARFLLFMGFGSPGAAAWGWLAAIACAAVFILYATHLPSVRAHLWAPTRLKLLAVAVAIAAGFCEEAIFRKVIMDALRTAGHGWAWQVLASAAAFGAVHAIWGLLRGSLRVAAGAMLATGSLGAALALVYLAAGRNLAPCVVAHFLINLLVEPGLVLAAVRGEMSH